MEGNKAPSTSENLAMATMDPEMGRSSTGGETVTPRSHSIREEEKASGAETIALINKDPEMGSSSTGKEAGTPGVPSIREEAKASGTDTAGVSARRPGCCCSKDCLGLCWARTKRCRLILFSLIKFLLTFLPWVDMITDGISVGNWKRLCEAGLLPCHFSEMGVIFLFLPTLVYFVFRLVWYKDNTLYENLIGLCYVLYAPFYAIIVEGGNLWNIIFHGEPHEDQDSDNEEKSMMLVWEALFEALPQTILQWYLIATKKDVLWNEVESFWQSFEFAITSAVISCLMIVWKLVVEPVKTRCYSKSGWFRVRRDPNVPKVSKFEINHPRYQCYRNFFKK